MKTEHQAIQNMNIIIIHTDNLLDDIDVKFLGLARHKCNLMPAFARSTLQGLSVARLSLRKAESQKVCLSQQSESSATRRPSQFSLTMLSGLSNLAGCRLGSSSPALLASTSFC
jgi:hypothetical protein